MLVPPPGSTQPLQGELSRVVFVEPGQGGFFHRIVMDDALNLDINQFCRDMAAAGLAWLAAAESTDNYQRNYDRFLQRYEGGLSPYFSGVNVIA